MVYPYNIWENMSWVRHLNFLHFFNDPTLHQAIMICFHSLQKACCITMHNRSEHIWLTRLLFESILSTVNRFTEYVWWRLMLSHFSFMTPKIYVVQMVVFLYCILAPKHIQPPKYAKHLGCVWELILDYGWINIRSNFFPIG